MAGLNGSQLGNRSRSTVPYFIFDEVPAVPIVGQDKISGKTISSGMEILASETRTCCCLDARQVRHDVGDKEYVASPWASWFLSLSWEPNRSEVWVSPAGRRLSQKGRPEDFDAAFEQLT